LLLGSDKVDHVDTFSMRGAVGGEAVGRLGFVVDLQRWSFVGMEGAAESHVFVWL